MSSQPSDLSPPTRERFQARYVVISPVKNEEAFVQRTLNSMVAQRVLPMLWIIVDDGSTDGTAALLQTAAREHSFIHVVRAAPGAARQPGSAVVRAFNRGYDALRERELAWDFIVKLDCDLSFEPDYFERLLAEFQRNPKLGIASGVYLENSKAGLWRVVDMPPYHAAGASKVIRRKCWDQIGGFVPARGWDTVDEIRAICSGWQTTHFSDLQMKHWKAEGSGIGAVRTNVMHGEIYYVTGGGPLFFLAKLLHRLKTRPYVFGGLAMAWGYLRAIIRRRRLVTSAEASRYRDLLRARMFGWLPGRREAAR